MGAGRVEADLEWRLQGSGPARIRRCVLAPIGTCNDGAPIKVRTTVRTN